MKTKKTKNMTRTYRVEALRPAYVEVEATSAREAIELARNGEGYIETTDADARILARAERVEG
jgi:acyl-CoA reductase-like NAD-dependent aldehyde dehydrogenase